MSVIDDLMREVQKLRDELERFKREQEYTLNVQGSRDAWQDSASENVQSGYPVTLRLYIPENNDTRHIKKVLLNVWLAAFRSYGTGAASGGGSTSGPSSASSSASQTVASSGSSSAASSSGGGGSTSGGATWWTSAGYTSLLPVTNWSGNHTHGGAVAADGNHRHEMDGVDHDHTVSSHTHPIPHTHDITAHTHPIPHTHSIDAHAHGITHGIYVDAGVASGCTITINTVDRTTALTGAATFSTDKTNLDITQYIVKGLNTISIASATIGRIDAMIFANVYLNG